MLYSLSGHIESEDVTELRRLLSLETAGETVALDLKEITLIDRDTLGFLADCECENIKLKNCPAYVREWLDCNKRVECG